MSSKGQGKVLNSRSLWRYIRRRLPSDREIIVRTGDRVAYLRLPRWLQLGFVGAAAVALAWIGLATHLNFNQLEIIAHREALIVVAEDARRDVQSELENAEKELALTTRRNEIGRQRADRLADTNQQLSAKIDELKKRITQHIAEQARGNAQRQNLDAEITTLQQRVDALVGDRARVAAMGEALRTELAQRAREKQLLTARIATLLPTIDKLEAERAQQTKTEQGLRGQLTQRIAERDSAAADRDRLSKERQAIANRFAALSEQLASLESAQEQIISRFDSQTVDSIELVEKTLAMTGVDVERLLGRLIPALPEGRTIGVGGPFIAAREDLIGPDTSELANNIAAVEERAVRWKALQDLLMRLPLAVPLDNYHVSSTFGRRVDPLTKRPAMHEGTDFSSERRAEIRSTSPGRVSFVGWRGGYGKMVEVDHGLGIRTRYAHLSKMYVKRGQQVDFRDKLGQVGNTGRSTGEHLHYEILLDGRALDPANFMKAGQYVFKN